MPRKRYTSLEDDKTPVNRFRVPRRMWSGWTVVGRHVFNKTFQYMNENQQFFKHPSADHVPDEYFRTTAWNAAVEAAGICSRGEAALLTQLVRELRGWDRYGDLSEKKKKEVE